MDLINYVRIIVGRWRIVAVICLVGVAAGWVTTPGAGDASASGFRATHTLYQPADPLSERTRSDIAQQLGVTELLVTTGEVPAQAATALNTTVPELLGHVTTKTDPAIVALSISAVDQDPQRAAEIANTLARELLANLDGKAQESYNTDLAQAQTRRDQLQEELDALPAASSRSDADSADRASVAKRLGEAQQRVQDLMTQGEPTSGFTSLQEAVAEPADSRDARSESSASQSEQSGRSGAGQDGPAQSGESTPAVVTRAADKPPDPILRALLGGAVGLLLGLGLALLRERLDARIRSREDAERAFGLPVLAEIPRVSHLQSTKAEIATVENGRALEAESYRALATSLLFRRGLSLGDHARDDQRLLNANGTSGRGSQATPPRPTHDPETIVAGQDVHLAGQGLTLLGRVRSQSNGSHALVLEAGLDATAAASYRQLGSSLADNGLGGPSRTLLVTSAMGEDSTMAAANLGMALAREGQRVAIIDGDLRRPQLHTYFDRPNLIGLTSVVSGEVGVSAAAQSVTGEARLSIVTTGPTPPDTEELVASPRTREVLAALAGTVDVMILLTAPVLLAGDASALAEHVDGAVLVATSGTTSIARLRQAVEALERSGASMLGVVLNDNEGGGRSAERNQGGRRDQGPTGDVILVTSPGAKDGKSSTTINLAAALAALDKSVLALDFDLRRPRLHQFLEADPDSLGMADALAPTGRTPMLEDIMASTPIPRLQAVASAQSVANPAELLLGAPKLISRARGISDMVLLDTPPVLAASDAAQLIPSADAVVLVCRSGTTRMAEAARVRQLLAGLEAPVLGLVLLGAQASPAARSYYYSRTSLRPWYRRRRGQSTKPPSPRHAADGAVGVGVGVGQERLGNPAATPSPTSGGPGSTKGSKKNAGKAKKGPSNRARQRASR